MYSVFLGLKLYELPPSGPFFPVTPSTTVNMSHNGDPVILSSSSPGLANYPQARSVLPSHGTKTLYISGITSRLADGTLAGVHTDSTDGSTTLDVAEQTSAILGNLEAIIKEASNGRGGLENVVDVTIFLIDLGTNYAGMNEVWNKTWTTREAAPARTCVGVNELPSPKLVVEFKATALIEI